MRTLTAVLILASLSWGCGGSSGGVESDDGSSGAPQPTPTIILNANPTAVASGGKTTLAWSTTNATSCTASGHWSGTKPTTGTETSAALTSSRTYTLVCAGSGGSARKDVSVTVTATPAPTLSLSATPSTISSGQSSTLNWSATNATSCTASGAWSGTKGTSGSFNTGALSATKNYTLACSGSSGTVSRTTTVTVETIPPPTGSVRFPLHTEAGKRYLVDANGQPFFIHGESAWALFVQLTREEADQYLEDRRLKGFNTVMVQLVVHGLGTKPASFVPPYNVYGTAPFMVDGDFSTPNEAYFAHAEYVIAKAAEKGMLVLLAPAYMGYQGGFQGWYSDMVANGETKLRGYGRYVANRFRAHDNIVWLQGGDFNPPEKVLLRAVANGIRDVDTRWLHSFHGGRGTSALGFLGSAEPWLGINDIYTDENTVVANAFLEYGRSSMPFFLIEARYENEGAGTEAVVRAQAYQAALSGAMGHVSGNNPIWYFGTGWQTALNSRGSVTLVHLRRLIDSLHWWSLQPDTVGALLTAGAGTGAARAVAARSSNGAFALLYAPSVRTLTVNLAQLAGPNVRARWYDPTNGAYTSVAGSPFLASGSRTFTPAGNNANGFGDWVLVLDSVP